MSTTLSCVVAVLAPTGPGSGDGRAQRRVDREARIRLTRCDNDVRRQGDAGRVALQVDLLSARRSGGIERDLPGGGVGSEDGVW